MPGLGDLPPWLNIQPAQFLQATEAGARAGLSVAELRQQAMARAAQMAEARARAQQQAWEFNETMRQRAAEQAALNQHRQSQIEQSRAENQMMMDYRNRQLASGGVDDALARERFGEVMRHNQAMEGISMDKAKAAAEQGAATIITHPEIPGKKFLRQPSGHEVPINESSGELTPSKKLELKMRGLGMMAPRGTEFAGDPAYQSRTNQVGQMLRELEAIPSPSAGTKNSELKTQAKAAIAAGAPESAVRKRYKEMTGEDLD
jgi:hypothetical protein